MLLYIAFSCIPFERIIPNSYDACLWIRIGVQIAFLITSFLIVKFKTDFNLKTKRKNFKMMLVLLPTIVVAASNFLYLGFTPTDINISYSYQIFLKLLLAAFVVLNEEFIFRFLFINNNETSSNWKKIIISSAFFALSHLSVFFSTFNAYDLIVPVYTFAFGILLGIIFAKTNSIEMCILFHFLFNVVNSIIFEMVVPNVSNIWFYLLANIIVVVAVVLYLLILLLTKKLIIDDESL